MKNPLTAGQQTQQTQPTAPDMGAMFQQFKQNPLEYLVRAKLNIPQGMTNPEQIVNHLLHTGQVPRQIMPQVQAMMRK